MHNLFLLTILLQVGIDDPNKFNGYLILGYIAMWVIGMVYVISLIIRQRNLHQDMQLMTRLLQDSEEEPEK